VSLGHRRNLLRALTALKLEASTSPRETSAILPEAHDAEQRQVTVFICDLVASTELANLLDPEDASTLLRRYRDACTDAVSHFSTRPRMQCVLGSHCSRLGG
jgi:class 3 adenylate cyclase